MFIIVFLWKILKQENVQYIVAPYEADAQMTFLAISGQVDVVITEDSDLIPFGCPRVSLPGGLTYKCFMLFICFLLYISSYFLMYSSVFYWSASLKI